MKRLILTFCLFLLAGSATAQITITEQDMRARLEEGAYAMSVFADIYMPAPLGSDSPADSTQLANDVQAIVDQIGTGGTYDLTGFNFQLFLNTVGEIRKLPVASDVPGASTFNGSGAEYVTISQDAFGEGTTYTYLAVQSDGLYEYGTVQEGEEPEVNDEPVLQQPLPLEMGASWSTVDSTSLFGFVSVDSTYSEVIGSGLLRTPIGTVPSLIVRQQSYSFMPNPVFGAADTSYSEAYTFHAQDFRVTASLTAASEETAPGVLYIAESNESEAMEVASGETGTLLDALGALIEFSAASSTEGHLQVFRYAYSPEENTFTGSATSPDGTTVTPTVVADGGYLVVQATGLSGFEYRICLDYGNRSDVSDPGKLVLLKREDSGASWAPLNTTLDEGAQQVCASGLDSSSQFALGSNAEGIGTAVEEAAGTSGSFALQGNAPNPFRTSTTIRYELPKPAHVTVDVFDALGRRIAVLADGRQPAGPQSIHFDAETAGLTGGVYVYRVRAGDHTATGRMVVLR